MKPLTICALTSIVTLITSCHDSAEKTKKTAEIANNVLMERPAQRPNNDQADAEVDDSEETPNTPQKSTVGELDPADSSEIGPLLIKLKPLSVLIPVDGNYTIGSELIFQLQFSEIVTITDTPSLLLRVGDKTVEALYSTGTNTEALEFIYIVSASDTDTDGVEILGHSAKGKVTNNAGNALDLAGVANTVTGILIDTNTPPPSRISRLVVAPTVTPNSLSIAWPVPAQDPSLIGSYLVQYRPLGTHFWQSTSVTMNSIVLTQLDAGSAYEFRVAAISAAVGPFSKISIAQPFNVIDLNPIAWLDATDILANGSNPEAGSKVGLWVDKTGRASNAFESEQEKQPILEYSVQNGLPAVRFENKAKGLEGTFTRTKGTDLTIVAVGQFDSNYLDRCLLEFRYQNSRAFFFDRRYASDTLFNPEITKGQFNLWVVENNGSSAKVMEGDSTIFDANTTYNTDFIGDGEYILGDDITGNNRLFGYIGEFLIFDQALSPSEIDTLKAYLQNKWGLLSP